MRMVSTIGSLDEMMGIGASDTPDPPPGPKKPPSQPAAVKPTKAAWTANGLYILQRGDTLWGLARTYLKAGTRWREIWALQSEAYKAAGCGPFPKRSPDKVCEGDVIVMPDEAKAEARRLGVLSMTTAIGGKKGLLLGGLAAAGVGVLSFVFGSHRT